MKQIKGALHSQTNLFSGIWNASWGTNSTQKPGDAPRMLTRTLQGFTETKEKHRELCCISVFCLFLKVIIFLPPGASCVFHTLHLGLKSVFNHLLQCSFSCTVIVKIYLYNCILRSVLWALRGSMDSSSPQNAPWIARGCVEAHRICATFSHQN